MQFGGKIVFHQPGRKDPASLCILFVCQNKNLEALLILVEMLAFPCLLRALPVAAAWGILMPGTIPNNRVSLPKWHKPLGKLEAVKPNNFQVII